MYGIIATWRMALEGITEAEHMLKDGATASDAIETAIRAVEDFEYYKSCLLYTSPSPRDGATSRMPSSA